jgi:transposase
VFQPGAAATPRGTNPLRARTRARLLASHPLSRRDLFFLPKSSPDLNHIEQVFAKLKHLLRKAAARTLETVVATIGQLLDAYTAPECATTSSR